jgi:ABC-2 type transporter
VALGGQRAFQPAFAPVHRRRPGTLTPTRRLGQAPIHHHITQLQADHLVIGAQRSRRQQARQPPAALLFGVHPASQLASFVVSVVLATAAMFAIGLLIAAIAPSTPVAGVASTALLYPMLFFAGLWAPQQNLSPLLQHIGNNTPLGAAVQAMEAAMQGNLPSARPLLVMAAYAIVFGIAAVKLFRWE